MSLNNRAIYILPASTASPFYRSTMIGGARVNKKELDISKQTHARKIPSKILPSCSINNKNISLTTPSLFNSSSSLRVCPNRHQQTIKQRVKLIKENRPLQRVTIPQRQIIPCQSYQKVPVTSMNRTIVAPNPIISSHTEHSNSHGIKRQLTNDINEDESLVDIDEVYELIGDSKDFSTLSLNSIPRKRERLTHLTPEEKLNRRKMKNRVAAQTARDRKKERTQRLEHAVKALLVETNRLRAENRTLVAENKRFINEKYQSPLSTSTTNIKNSTQILNDIPSFESSNQQYNSLPSLESIDLKHSKKAFGSAEFIYGPQQRDQAFRKMTLSPKFNTMASLMMLLRTILFLTIANVQSPIIPQWMMICKKFLVIFLAQNLILTLTLIVFVMKSLMMNLLKIKNSGQFLHKKLSVMIQQLRHHLQLPRQPRQHNQHVQFLLHHMNLHTSRLTNKNKLLTFNVKQQTQILMKIMMNTSQMINCIK